MPSPSAQPTEAANKARRLIFMIRRSVHDLSKSAFIPLYGALLRLHLEYGMPTCSPNLVADINHLERIQRLATRLVTGMHHLPYEERLQRLGLHSLQLRRLWADLIKGFKVFMGLLDTDSTIWAVMLEENLVPTRKLSSNRALRVHYVSAFGQGLTFTCSKYSSGQSVQIECTPYVNFGHGGRVDNEAVWKCLLRSSSHVPTPTPTTGLSVITHLA